jgi:quinol monooxygenase YgiN
MVIRLFRGRVKTENLKSLDKLLADVTLPLLQKWEGLVCYHVGRPMAPDANEFLVLTVWKDLQALKEFSGEDWQNAVIPQQMAAILEASNLLHFSVL